MNLSSGRRSYVLVDFQVFQNPWLSLIFILSKLIGVMLRSRLTVQVYFYCFTWNYVFRSYLLQIARIRIKVVLYHRENLSLLKYWDFNRTKYIPRACYMCMKWMIGSALLGSSRDLVDKNWTHHFAKVCISFIPLNSSTLELICLAPVLGYTSRSKAYFDNRLLTACFGQR